MKKRFAAAVICLAVLSQTAFAALGPVNRLSAAPSGTVLDSPTERVFRIVGSEKEFVILDANSDESEYFVIAKDVYGNKQYDPNNTQKFDVEDTNNIAYWLNNDFVMSGNGNGNALPSEILKYIDFDHIWTTEAGYSGGNCPEDYTFKAGLALMSQTEYVHYAGRFGIKDNTSNGGWWLRTGRGLQGAKGLVLRVGLTGDAGTTAGWDSNYANGSGVKPVFWLKREFFANVELAAGMGEIVQDILKKYYTYEDLKNLYSGSRLINELGYLPEISLTEDKTEIKDGNFITQLSVLNNTPLRQSVVVVAAAYDYRDKCLDFNATELTAEKNGRDTITLTVPCSDGGYAMYFLLSSDGNMEMLSNSITVRKGNDE